MNQRMKLQLSVLIGVAVLLIPLVIIGVIFAPVASVKKATTTPGNEKLTVNKYSITGRILNKEHQSLANTKFRISVGPTDFTTDDNGYFVFNNLPVGAYELYGFTAEGTTCAKTEFELSNDGCVSVGYTFFEKGERVVLIYDGGSFTPYKSEETEEPDDGGTENPADGPKSPADEPKSPSDGPKNPADEPKDPAAGSDDSAYTNFSWMKNVSRENGAYGISIYRDPELFYEILNDPSFAFMDTFFLEGSNIEVIKKTAEELKRYDKKMWLSVNDLLALGSGNPATNLNGDWRKLLTEYATIVKSIAGDNFQGFYFDEPSYYYTDKDYTRITKYMRETFKLRTFAVHCSAAYMTPYNKGRDIIGYKATTKDLMVINAENHKYTTDVGWWRYGAVRLYGDIDISFGEWSKAMSLLDPNTRKWIVPVVGAYDWRSIEEDTLDVQWTMFKSNSQLEGFGGIMHYTMALGSLSGKPTTISPDDKRLTDEDFLKDENGAFVLDTKGQRIVNLKFNNSSVNLPNAYMEGNAAYFIVDRLEDGTLRWPRVRQYVEILGNGFKNGKSYDSILKELESVYKPDFSKFK